MQAITIPTKSFVEAKLASPDSWGDTTFVVLGEENQQVAFCTVTANPSGRWSIHFQCGTPPDTLGDWTGLDPEQMNEREWVCLIASNIAALCVRAQWIAETREERLVLQSGLEEINKNLRGVVWDGELDEVI